MVSYEEWPNGAWANGIVPENNFRLFTIPGPSYDSTDNILEFHSEPILTEIDVPPAIWAQRGQTKPVEGLSALPAYLNQVVGSQEVTTTIPNNVTNLTVTGSISARKNMGMVGDATTGLIFGGENGGRKKDFYKYEISGNGVTATNLTVTEVGFIAVSYTHLTLPTKRIV